MKRRFVREWLLALCLVAGAACAPGCSSSSHKKTILVDSGDAGAAGVADSTPGAGRAGDLGSPPEAGAAGAEAGAGGAAPGDGFAGDGFAGDGAAGDGQVVLDECQGELQFADSNFESSVRLAIDKPDGVITAADVATLTEFTLQSIDGTIDIGGIECLTALETVHFGDNSGAKPLSALAALPKLRTLDLHHDYLSNDGIAELGQVTQLTSLDLSQNFITDFTALAPLVNLKSLDLSGNDNFAFQTSDLTPLSALTQLETLSLDSLLVSNIAPLGALTQLRQLSLASLKLTSISPLAGLTQLTQLDLSGNSLSIFTPLSSFKALTHLKLSSTGLSSLTALAPLSALTTLDLSYDPITDITVLGTLPALVTLTLSNSSVTSLAPLLSGTYPLGSGDELFAEALDCNAFGASFTALAGKGVTLHTSCN